MSTQKGSPSPEWKHAWKDAKTGDDVYLHEDDGAVFLDMADRGHEHPDGTYCHLCLPRLNAAGDAARKCLDPKAAAFVDETVGKDDGPAFLALVPGMNYSTAAEDKKAFSMRHDGGVKLVFNKPILTTKKDNKPFSHPIFLAEYVTKNFVCDANYLRAFSVRLKDGVPEHYARRLWEAKLTFTIDGENLVNEMPFKEALQQKEILLPKPVTDGSCLFSALGVMDPMGAAKAVASEWLGYMLPNGTVIRVTLDNVEGGGGLIFIETSWKLVRYTTKKPTTKA